MGKSKNKNHSEVEFLRGQVRKLASELKYYKKRAHIVESTIDDAIEENELYNINAKQCPRCGKGNLIELDFYFATLSRCDHCSFEKREGKSGTKKDE